MSKDTIEKHQRTEHKAERRAELRPAAVESATVFGCDRLGLGSYGCPANAAQRSPFIQWTWSEIPYATEQGIFAKEQGI
jgi:hypothetical protein